MAENLVLPKEENVDEVTKEYMVIHPDGSQWGTVAYRGFAESYLANGKTLTNRVWNNDTDEYDTVEEVILAPEGSFIAERTVTRSAWYRAEV
jgi:hypothetical protein